MRKDKVFFVSMLLFLLGIAAGSFFPGRFDGVFFGALVVWIAGAVAFPSLKVFLVGSIPVVFCCGGMLSAGEMVSFTNLPVSDTEQSGIVRIISDPEEHSFYKRVIVRFETCSTSECPKQYVLWQAPLFEALSAGDRISFSCRLELPENFEPGFDYRMFLAKDGIGYVCKKAEIGRAHV